MSSGIKVNLDSILIFTLGFGFCFLEPLDERLSLLMDLGCCFLGNILLRNLFSPLKENLFFNDVLFIERFKDVRNFVHQDCLVNFDGLLQTSEEILLSLLIFMRESEYQITILLNLFLLEHLVIEQKLTEDNRRLVSDLETISLGNDLLGSSTLVDGTSILLVDDKLVEDVHPLLLRLLKIIVNDKAAKSSTQSFHSLSDSFFG